MNMDYDWDNYRNIDLNELIIEAEKSISQNNISNAKLWYIKAMSFSNPHIQYNTIICI